MNKQFVSVLKQVLLQEHQFADENLGKTYIDEKGITRYVINTREGNYEYDRNYYYNKGQKYIGISKFQPYWSNEYFQQAYKELVEEGRLERQDNNQMHFRLIYIDKEDFISEVFKSIDKHPTVPPHLRPAYNSYINSNEWKEKREKVLNRDHHKCCKCGSQLDLQVHHLVYDENSMFDPNEDLSHLQTLCCKCHKEESNE